MKKKSLLNWIFSFAGEKKTAYCFSVFFALLRQNGLRVAKSQVVKGRIDLLYVECAFE